MSKVSRETTFDRYSNAADLADDLRQMLASELENESERADTSEFRRIKIVPRGLRAYDAEDADFFQQLLPGPRDRFGMPEIVSYWKSRCEQGDPVRSFRVALLYGPSGCGKSSFVKAGLIPQLSNRIVSVHVESSADGTERDIKQALGREFDYVDPSSDVVRALKVIRKRLAVEGRQKVVIFLDQFEQWFGGQHRDNVLRDILRQCDGKYLACVLMLRDEYWMASTRLMQEIEIPIRNENCRALDLFDTVHAKENTYEYWTGIWASARE